MSSPVTQLLRPVNVDFAYLVRQPETSKPCFLLFVTDALEIAGNGRGEAGAGACLHRQPGIRCDSCLTFTQMPGLHPP